jgi:hypothetical protein
MALFPLLPRAEPGLTAMTGTRILWDGMNFLDGLAGAAYALTLTDNKGCTAAQAFIVEEPDSLWMAAIVEDVRCAGGEDGFIQVTPQGGTLPYQLSWEPPVFGGQTILEDLTEGLYILTTSRCSAVRAHG